jgi:predicted transcriptional regulator
MSDNKPSPRRRLLDLAPLELDCMNTLWPIGQATVREIRDGLAARRPRAYTTIMTIMDRLARKGVVERVKAGRAYLYRARLTADEARTQALGQVLENFFGGSKEALVAHLGNGNTAARRAAAAAGAGAGNSTVLTTSANETQAPDREPVSPVEHS